MRLGAVVKSAETFVCARSWVIRVNVLAITERVSKITNAVDECQGFPDLGTIERDWNLMKEVLYLPLWVQSLNKTEFKTEAIIITSVPPIRTVLLIRDRQEGTL